MIRRICLLVVALGGAPALAEENELTPVPAQVMIGRSYSGDLAASKIRFINARARPVAIAWLSFDGKQRQYAVVQSGDELVQPTFVGHRWLVKDHWDGTPLEAFVSTRSAARDDGATQVAIVR